MHQNNEQQALNEKHPNLLKEVVQSKLEEILVSDITYVHQS
ncbi:hypothetical protein VS_0488 [Vibrio atlanticus]|uniref:Uncharacterized protein n=1 Tax=Vibrio atlanticus (strain LGP32) TaxID=575788 RepID=B7VJ40_VIBA3|nr:hypothetical protein VS_0488 [Vibrio atlanticus]